MTPRSLGVLCAALVMGPLLSTRAAEVQATVGVSGGRIAGRMLPGGGAVFRGLPFAAPPVGELRWREPSPVKPWTGVREAVEAGPPCAQPKLGWNDAFAAAGREDCLYLDVWAPHWPPRPGRPVMVWLHGGANMGGAGGADPLYDGTVLIRHDVVLVNVQYRLGIFGFFAHPELSRESAHGSSGNYGILDQIAALRWVRDNIAAFGGDPGSVTLFGQSAGAIDASLLAAAPLAKGLFQRAIGESGPMVSREPAPTLARAEEAGSRLAERLKTPPDDPLPHLRSLPTATLLEARSQAQVCVDGWVLPESPSEAFAAGRQQRMPMIIGSNAVEFAAEGSVDELRERIETLHQARAPRALALYGLATPAEPSRTDPVYGGVADQVGTDGLRCAIVIQGEWHSDAGNATWEYQFDRAIPPRPRTAHSSELPYVFGNLYSSGSQAGEFQEADRTLSAAMRSYWTNFARAGDPNGAGLAAWPRFDRGSGRYLEFTADGGTAVSALQRRAFCDLFREGVSRRFR